MRARSRAFGLFAGLILGALSGGCVYDGLVIADDSGFSLGPSRDGALHNGTRLPAQGQGYRIPPTWRERGLNYGIEELVSVLVYVGRTLHMQDEGLVLSVADVSRARGGRSQWHRSHQTGRDVDLLFFVRDAQGRVGLSEEMLKHGADGAERVTGGTKPALFFDVPANWDLVAALLDNPIVDVQYIFIQDDLRQLLLEHAASRGVPRSLIARAAYILRQPSDSAPHDDHMHVRIFCPKNDLGPGCVDFGQLRWHKRDYKYDRRVDRLTKFETIKLAGTMTALPWLWR